MSNKKSNNSKNVSASSSSSTSNQQLNKTQVFILRPEILKKLGISAQIPNLQSLTNSENSENNAITNTKQSIANTTNITTNNKQNETEDNQRSTSKSDNIGTVKRNSKPMVNLPKVSGLGKKKQVKLNTKEQRKETDVYEEAKETVSKEEKQKIIKDIDNAKISDPTSVEEKFNIANSLKSKLSAMLNQKLGMNTKKIHVVESINDNKHKMNTSVKISELKRSCSTPKITKKQNVSAEKQKKDFVNKINNTLPEILLEKQPLSTVNSMKMQIKQNLKLHVGTKPEVPSSHSEDSVGKSQSSKQKITKLSSPEEIASNSDKEADLTPIRKSGRKRKLSNLHEDFVTELKLHDGIETNRKKVTKTRKSVDSTMVNAEENVGSKGVDDVESKKQIRKKKNIEETNTSLQIVADSKIVETKPIVVKTYSRTKKLSPSNNESNLHLQQPLKSDSNVVEPNDNISKSNIDNSIKDIDAYVKNTGQEINTEPMSTDNKNSKKMLDTKSKLETLDFVADPTDRFSKRKVLSMDDSGEKESDDNSESSQPQQKSKIRILEIQTFNQTEHIKTAIFDKADSVDENSKNYAPISQSAIEPTKENVQEVLCEKTESVVTDLIEINNVQLSSAKMSTKCNNISSVTKISGISTCSEHLLKDIGNESNKDISKNNLSETCEIQEDTTSSISTKDAVFKKQVPSVSSGDKQNEIIDKLENQDILIGTTQLHNTIILVSDLDKIVEENKMQDKVTIINHNEICEDPKSKQIILNETVDNLKHERILNDTFDYLKNITEESVGDKSRKNIIVETTMSKVDPILESSETISNKQSRKTIQPNNDILISLEASHSETLSKQDNFEDEIKIEKNPKVNASEVSQESFSVEPNITTSTPIVKRRPGRPRKSNLNFKDSNLVNTKSKNTSLLDTTADSTEQNSLLSETDASEIGEIHIEAPIKKRPGRPRKKPLVQEKLKLSQSATISEEIDTNKSISLLQNTTEHLEDEDEPLVKRKPGRPRKIKEDTTDEEEENQVEVEESKNSENDESLSENKRTWKRGRKRKGAIEEENARKKKPVISADGLVQCAVCKIEIKNSNWANHCAKHNFLTWRVGEDEIDLQDRVVVSSILYKAIKGRKHVFSCETCGDKKKSVVGYLSHLDQCQKTKEEIANMRVACTICNRLMQPVSLKVHMAIHNEKAKLENTLDDVPIDTKNKRQAAKKAVGLIQEVTQEENDKPVKKTCRKAYKKVTDSAKLQLYGGLNQSLKSKIEKTGTIRCQIKKCTYETKNLAELKEHFNSCPELKENDVVCCYCLHVLDNEVEMIQHVKENHLKSKEEDSDHVDEEEMEEEEDDDEDEFAPDEDEVAEKRSRTILTVTQRKYTYKIDFLAKEKRMLPSLIITYPATIKWTMDFVRENYAEKQLFPKYNSLSINWTLLTEEKYKDYMPDLNKSMCVEQVVIKHTIPCLQGREYSWKEYNLFESGISEDTATIFCGGPIWSLAWAPTPVDMEVDQILAVSIQKNPDKTYKMSQSYSSPEMIQFWNFGVLKNMKQLNVLPSLEFCMLHDHGMIWHMEWCPSGCYDEEVPEDLTELRRLGLLAVACSDGNIIIYSIHFPDNSKESNVLNMVKPKEMYKLIVQGPSEQRLGLWDYQATKLSWTKAVGHNIVAGGYSNGMVCLFNLKTESPICKSEENGVTILTPYLTFHPHCAVITALSLHPLDGGGRWLVTGSWDRSCKYWDLNDISTPITAYLKRGLITDGVWMSHWLCSFLTYDDVFNLSHTVTTIQNVRDYSYKQTSALATNSMITSISANDWANAVAQGSLAGELTGSFPRQLLVSFDVDKGLKCKRVIFGYSELVEKNLEPAERMKKIKQKTCKKDVDFSDKDDKYIFKYFMNKDEEEFDQEPETYNEAQKKYGLVFGDFKLDSYSQIPPDGLSWVRQSSRMHEAPLELYPLMSINRVQWNPNKQSYLYLATGHQTGFVRLKCVRFMNTKL